MSLERAKITVAWDVDGVLRDLHLAIYGALLEAERDVPPPAHWTEWDVWKLLGMSQDEFYRFVWEEHVEEVVGDAPPVVGALAAVEFLRYAGIRQIIVSSQPNQRSVKLTRAWLDARGFGLRVDEIHILLGPMADKTQVALDVLIDDAPHNLEAARRAGRMAIAIDQPWNRGRWNGTAAKEPLVAASWVLALVQRPTVRERLMAEGGEA